MTRHEIGNAWNGPLIAHTTQHGAVALTVSSGHPDDGRVSATVYLDRDQVAQLISALQDCRDAQWGAAVLDLGAMPRATEMGSGER